MKAWGDAEIEFVRQNAGRITDEIIAATIFRIFGRPTSVHAIRRIRYRLGLTKKHGRGLCEVDRSRLPGVGLHVTAVKPDIPFLF